MKSCPECGAPSPVHDVRDVAFSYKGRNTLIPAVSGYHCASCGEVTLDREAVDRYGDQVEAFQRKVNSELVDPAFILAVRKKLGLDQRQAGEIFGGGVNAFSRYENGKAQPHPSAVKLLKLLDLYPELLEKVRSRSGMLLETALGSKTL